MSSLLRIDSLSHLSSVSLAVLYGSSPFGSSRRIILFSFLVSGLTIAMASKSKTFKEAQSALAPINMIVMLPGLISYLMNLKTTPLYSVIPFLNLNLIFSDAVKGDFNIINIGLMIISTIIFITLLLSFIIKQYKSEKTLFG